MRSIKTIYRNLNVLKLATRINITKTQINMLITLKVWVKYIIYFLLIISLTIVALL
jgi:hypothetical protein